MSREAVEAGKLRRERFEAVAQLVLQSGCTLMRRSDPSTTTATTDSRGRP
ncbi:hypothetical protein E3A20_22760, partial [Planctomyces bekefii]